MPELNIPLFRKIHAQIESFPESHNQGSWECGTSRCVAGWAVHLTTGQPVYATIGLHSATRKLVEELDVRDTGSIPAVARRLLGITADEAGRLFYADEAQAAEAVRLAATGQADAFARYVQTLDSVVAGGE